jgi:hypothetical protein
MGVWPVMTCTISIDGPCGFSGFTILVGSMRGVAQLCGGIAVGGLVQWELLVTMKLLPCHSILLQYDYSKIMAVSAVERLCHVSGQQRMDFIHDNESCGFIDQKEIYRCQL